MGSGGLGGIVSIESEVEAERRIDGERDTGETGDDGSAIVMCLRWRT